jgi:hypothetical protein
VNIQVKNASANASTDMDGRFLEKPAGRINISFSYIDTNLEYKVVSSIKTISISLQEDSKVLNEVVVIGYGSQKERSYWSCFYS